MGKLLVNKIREINPLAKRGTLLLLALLAPLARLLGSRDSEAAVGRNVNWAKFGQVTFCTLLLSVLMFGGWFGPKEAQAITTSIAPTVVSGTTAPATTSFIIATSATGQRMLVAGVSVGTSAAVTPTVTCSWGGTNLTAVINTDSSSKSSTAHTYLFYMLDNPALMDGITSQPLTFAIANLGTATLVSNSIHYAVYDAVNQITPLGGYYNNGTTTTLNMPLSPALTINAGDIGFTVSMSVRSGSTNATGRPITAAAGWASATTVANTNVNPPGTTLRYSFTSTTVGSTSAQHTVGTAAILSSSGMVVQAAPTNVTTAGTATATAANAAINIVAPYSGDANGNNTLLVEYKLTSSGTYGTWENMGHSATPYTTVITGLTNGTSYDVRITYQDPDTVSGTAVQTITGVTPVAGAKNYYMTRDTSTNFIADGLANVIGTTPYTSTGVGKTTAASAEFGTASRYYPTIAANTTATVLNVYTPAYSNAVNISGISASAAIRAVTATDTARLDLYDYDPNGVAGNGTLVATGATKTLTGGTATTAYAWLSTDFTINGTGRVVTGHRLQFRFTYTTGATAGTPRFYFGIAGATSSTNFTVTESYVTAFNTTAGTATATVDGSTRISISAPYTDDDNNNNTLLVEYKKTTDPTYTAWSTLPHMASPFVTTITGLVPNTSYDVRVTYQDVNGVTGTATQVITPLTTLPGGGIEAYDKWTRVINDAINHTTGSSVDLNGSFAVSAPSGSSRLLVLAISQGFQAGSTAPQNPSTVSYGGVPLTRATSNNATSNQAHTWLYYLKDNAVMNGTAQPVSVSWSTGLYSTKIDVDCAVYTGVDPVPASYTVGTQIGTANGTTAISLSAALPVPAKAQAIYLLNAANIANTTVPSYTTNSNWTTPLSSVPTTYTGYVGSNYAYSIQHANMLLPLADTTDSATTGTRNVNSYFAMSAMVLPPVAVTFLDGAAPPALNVYAGDTNKVVDAFTMTGTGTVTNIQVTGNANTTNTNISAIRIYRKGDANKTVYTPPNPSVVDTLIGSGVFGAVGTTPVNITVTEPITAATDYIIVYDIASGAQANGVATTFTATVTALTPGNGAFVDTGATLTLLPTLTLGNGVEPPSARLWKSSPATNLDAFTLGHNGTSPTDDDTISNITVTLAPQYISGGSGGTISKFKLVEVVNAAGTVVYGSANAATTGDIWNIPTTGLVATSAVAPLTPTTYYIRVTTADVITPSAADTSGTLTGFYPPVGSITGTVTALSHSKPVNKLVLGDTTSAASFNIDVEKPTGPASATATTGTTGGTIDLVWAAANDPNAGALDALKPYKIVRSAPDGVQPSPGCVDGTALPDQTGTSFTDTGLISTTPTRYYYRVCARDVQGNMSDGAATFANAKVINVCNNPPSITLTAEDLLSTSQVVKSNANTAPFKLMIANNDTGVCPDVDFTVALSNVVGIDADFSKTLGATYATAQAFPATVTLGTGGAGSPTGKTLNLYITGLPGANQLEHYKFAVTVSTAAVQPKGAVSHGAAITSPTLPTLMDAILNDMPPIVHNSSNMGKFQYGNWGQTYTCATCHSNSTTNIKGVYNIISTPIGRRNVVFSKTSSIDTDYIGVYSNDKRTVNNISSNVCSVCHHQTRQHQYSANKLTGGPVNEPYNSDHHNSRDCVRCHTHNTAFRSIYGLCGDCHGFKATGYSPVNKQTMVKDLTNALGPNPPNYGAHQRHNTAALTCAACHNNTNHGLDTTAWQGNNFLEIGFTVDKNTFPGFNPAVNANGGKYFGTNNLNVPFKWTAGPFTNVTTIADYNASCNTYCHGKWTGNTGTNTTPIWVGTGQAACGSCHAATSAVPPSSGSHTKHSATSGAGLGIACIKCHSTYTSYTGSAHINGNVEWKLDMTGYPVATGTYNGANAGSTGSLAPSAAYSTCTALYCHSNVQGPVNGTGLPTFYAVAKWGDPATATCNSCHPANPNTSGSHSNHENAQVAFDCHVCHDTGGTTSPLNHANGKVDFKFVGLGKNTRYMGISSGQVTPGTGYGTCTNSDCHGRFNRAWGTLSSGLTLCDKCHGSATSPGGFYNTRGPAGTLSVYSTGVGVHDIHVQNTNSPRKATFARFTSYAAGYSCTQCHTVPTGPFSAGHIDTPLPAEVPFNNKSSIASKGKTFGYYSTPVYNFGTQSCSAVWCHGAGMDSNRGVNAYVGAPPASRQNPLWNTPFLTGAGATDCNKCHATPPAAPNSTYTHFGKSLASCSSCHQHVGNDGLSFKNKKLHADGKVDGGCTACHGNPPITNLIGTTTGLATPAQNALNGGAGAHNVHVLLPAIGKNCSTCHNGASQAMPSNQLEMGFNALSDGLGGYLVKSGTFTGYTSSVNGPNWVSSSTGTTIVKSAVKAATCSVYCHGGGSPLATPPRPALGGGLKTTPDWESITQCGDCHGIDSMNAPTGGSHTRHATQVATLKCESCHGVTVDNGTHVNGFVSWKLDRANPLFGASATYNSISSGSLPGPAPRAKTPASAAAGDDYRVCSNVYCHSTVQGATGTGSGVNGPTVATWGNNGSMNCGSCHKNAATDSSAPGSHAKHANTSTGMGLSCGYCHQTAGFGTTLHTDGSVYVNFTSYIMIGGNTYSAGTPLGFGKNKISGSAAYGTCSNTFCHGIAPSPAWGTVGTLACNACHSAKVDDVSWSGRHKTHYNYSTVPSSYTYIVQDLSNQNKYRFNCAHCHDSNATTHSLKPTSVDSAARVFFGISSATPASSSKRGTYSYGAPAGVTDNGFNYTSGSCNGSYCHSNGRGGSPIVSGLTWTTTPTAGSNCLYCHDGKRTSIASPSNLSGKHDKHMNYSTNQMIGLGNGGFNCVDCHSSTITNSNNLTIANKGNHVNGMVNFSGAKANKGLDTSVAKNGECNNVYCHSNGNPNAIVFVSMTGSKGWNGAKTITTCNNCHGRGNSIGYPDYANGGANSATSNLHQGHLAGMSDTTACADCHRKTPDALVANKFRPYSTLHLSGGVNVNFNTAKTYIGTKATQSTVGLQVTCSNIVCHGQGKPVWGASTTANTCQKCHGSKSTAFGTFSSPQVAPGYGSDGTDTSMTNKLPTDPRVGAHQRHLVSNAISAPIKCSECHVAVTNIRAGNHWNYSTATLTFSGRATANSHTPTVSGRTNGALSCSNTNCHGGKYNSGTTISPFWNMTGLVKETGTTVGACTKCHAMPPTAYVNHPAAMSNISSISTIYNRCGGCHNTLSSTATNVGNVFNNKATHINGTIDFSIACNGCHDYDTTNGGTTWGKTNYGGTAALEGRGAHAKHIQYLKSRYNVTLNASTDTYGSAAMTAVCGVCHSVTPADHDTGLVVNNRNINFGGSTVHQFGPSAPAYNGNSVTSSSVNPKSCSNTDCHFKTSPIWSTY
jgi:predicted CxxxxCH...CXXCH cytochrome family protein